MQSYLGGEMLGLFDGLGVEGAESYGRYVVKIILGGISLFTVPFTNRQKAIHDFAVKSMMIRV